jgi:hypothetical protein
VEAIAVDPVRARVVYVASNDQLLRSDDAGRTWTAVGEALSSITDLAVDPNDRNTVYASSCGSGVLALQQDVAVGGGSSDGCAVAPAGRPSRSAALLPCIALVIAALRRLAYKSR